MLRVCLCWVSVELVTHSRRCFAIISKAADMSYESLAEQSCQLSHSPSNSRIAHFPPKKGKSKLSSERQCPEKQRCPYDLPAGAAGCTVLPLHKGEKSTGMNRPPETQTLKSRRREGSAKELRLRSERDQGGAGRWRAGEMGRGSWKRKGGKEGGRTHAVLGEAHGAAL